MRKFICFMMLLLIAVSCLSACADTPVQTVATEEEPALQTPQESMEFTFSSGAGAWRTMLILNADGTFSGTFLDSDMGDADESYPNGTAHICEFSGKFEGIEKVNDYSYKMTLTTLETAAQSGDEWIEEGVRYIASEPYGLNCGAEFMLYLPETPLDALSEDFLSWWPHRFDQSENPSDMLNCYGIMNVEKGYGFFN